MVSDLEEVILSVEQQLEVERKELEEWQKYKVYTSILDYIHL